jgi:ATP-dependent Lhr-like helicase
MNSPSSVCDEQAAFAAYHPKVQDLVRHDLGWRHLRPVQTQAASPVRAADRDVLVIAGTAGGKTEAVWFPVFSRLLADGVRCASARSRR